MIPIITGSSSAASPEVPGLRPIETPPGGGGDDAGGTAFFSSSSPTSPSPKSTASIQSGGACSPEEYVLPYHGSGHSGSGGAQTAFRRIRTKLASPFRSPFAGAGHFTYDEENILVQSGGKKRSKYGSRSRSAGSDRAAALYRNIFLVILGVGAVGMWAMSRDGGNNSQVMEPNTSSDTTERRTMTAAAKKTPFTFRPVNPPEGSLTEDAIDLYRQAYGSTGDADVEEAYIGIDDPANPGSIFVVLDLIEDATSDNFVTQDGPLFRKMTKFNDNFVDALVQTFPETARDNNKSESGKEENSAAEGNEMKQPSSPPFFQVTSYYSILSQNLPHIASAYYATPDGFTTLMEVKFGIPSRHIENVESMDSYTQSVVEAVRSYVTTTLPEGITAEFTGLPLFQKDLRPESTRPELMGSSLDDLLVPDSPSLRAYHHLAHRFGWGIVSPYRIIFDHSDAESSIDTDPGFKLMHRVMAAFAMVDLENETDEEEAEEVLETVVGLAAVNLDSIPQRIEDGHMGEHLTEVMDELYGAELNQRSYDGAGRTEKHYRRESKPPTRTVYNGVAFLRNNQVPYPLYLGAKICREKQHHHCNLELLHYFTAMTDAVTSKDRMTTYITASLGVDPFSLHGIAWLMSARKKINELEANGQLGGYRVSIVGGASLEYDAWFESQQQYKQKISAGGAGEEPSSPSSSSTLDSTSPLSSISSYWYILLFIGLAGGIGVISLSRRSKRSAYSHKNF